MDMYILVGDTDGDGTGSVLHFIFFGNFPNFSKFLNIISVQTSLIKQFDYESFVIFIGLKYLFNLIIVTDFIECIKGNLCHFMLWLI